jgi:hypothetical protein
MFSRMYRLLAGLVLVGCAGNTPNPSPEPWSPDATIIVSAENRRSDDVVVSLVRNGHRERLGLVTAQSKTSFSLPYGRLGNSAPLALLVSPIGGARGYLTENLPLRPGSEVSLTVTPLIRQTWVSVY